MNNVLAVLLSSNSLALVNSVDLFSIFSQNRSNSDAKIWFTVEINCYKFFFVTTTMDKIYVDFFMF